MQFSSPTFLSFSKRPLLLKIFFFLVLFASLNSQEAELAATTPLTADQSQLQQYELFAPRLGEVQMLKKDFESEGLKRLQAGLEQIRTELKSTYDSLKYYKLVLDRELALRGASFYQLPLDEQLNYYPGAEQTIRNNFYLDRSIIFLEQIKARYQRYETLFITAVAPAELQNTLTSLYGLLGIAYLYKGTRRSLSKAINSFEFLLGKNSSGREYTQSQAEKISVFNYLVGAYDELIKTSLRGEREALVLTRKKLYYLWQIALLENKDNETLKTAKLRHLAKDYYPAMDYYGDNFRQLYRDYVNVELVPAERSPKEQATAPPPSQGTPEEVRPAESVIGVGSDGGAEKTLPETVEEKAQETIEAQ